MTSFSPAKLLSSVHVWLADHAPMTGVPVRFAHAAAATLAPTRPTYSQHGEDAWLLEQLRDRVRPTDIYVDVGANHPTRLSNTYLLYRAGHRGVVIEPNAELRALHAIFRPRDVALAVGCGASAAVAELHVTGAPGGSSFRPGAVPSPSRVVRTVYVPVLPVDDILKGIHHDRVTVLSIDTEGFDVEVLRGARETLKKTLFACVEISETGSEDRVARLLEGDFDLVKRLGCNVIWRNRHLA